MKISILLENSALCDRFECDHGLSVYVETEKHKILVDLGPNEKTLFNAEKMGIDLKAVDTVFLSHGHYDHSGGIMPFCGINNSAPVYMRSNAAGDYYHDERYIGIDKAIVALPQVKFVEGDTVIDGELSLFTGITGRRYWPESNRVLSVKVGEDLVQDEFTHEQCVVVDSGKKLLVSGCAHNGILNILDRYKEIYGGYPDAVISGFHMMKQTDYTPEEINTVEDTARELSKLDTVFYTGHCTGDKAFRIMNGIMKDNLRKISSGLEFYI